MKKSSDASSRKRASRSASFSCTTPPKTAIASVEYIIVSWWPEIEFFTGSQISFTHEAQREIPHGPDSAILGHCSYEDRKYENPNRTKAELIAEILREYERSGDAMRYLTVEGNVAWRATPFMLQRLADAEREVEDDMADFP